MGVKVERNLKIVGPFQCFYKQMKQSSTISHITILKLEKRKKRKRAKNEGHGMQRNNEAGTFVRLVGRRLQRARLIFIECKQDKKPAHCFVSRSHCVNMTLITTFFENNLFYETKCIPLNVTITVNITMQLVEKHYILVLKYLYFNQ